MADENGEEKRAVKLGEGALDEVAGGAFYKLGGARSDAEAYDALPRLAGDACPYCGMSRTSKAWGVVHYDMTWMDGRPIIRCTNDRHGVKTGDMRP